jgi:hypothetical protein
VQWAARLPNAGLPERILAAQRNAGAPSVSIGLLPGPLFADLGRYDEWQDSLLLPRTPRMVAATISKSAQKRAWALAEMHGRVLRLDQPTYRPEPRRFPRDAAFGRRSTNEPATEASPNYDAAEVEAASTETLIATVLHDAGRPLTMGPIRDSLRDMGRDASAKAILDCLERLWKAGHVRKVMEGFTAYLWIGGREQAG